MSELVLPRDVIEVQLDELELLRAMYPEELLIDQPTEDALAALRNYCQDLTASIPDISSRLSVQLNLALRSVSSERLISLFVELNLTPEDPSPAEGSLSLRVRQPEWLTKAETSELTLGIPNDIVSAIEYVLERATSMISAKSDAGQIDTPTSSKAMIRVWFYFPSISTREKRDDIVRHAPEYELTGFLLAGKPGILCLEGNVRDIDEYMRFIKSVSWSDIPSQHKKVSERYRESGSSVTRVFPNMAEITDLLEKRGERSNRGDMKALETWLGKRGLGDAFSSVLF